MCAYVPSPAPLQPTSISTILLFHTLCSSPYLHLPLRAPYLPLTSRYSGAYFNLDPLPYSVFIPVSSISPYLHLPLTSRYPCVILAASSPNPLSNLLQFRPSPTFCVHPCLFYLRLTSPYLLISTPPLPQDTPESS